jgi:hypothetical protein
VDDLTHTVGIVALAAAAVALLALILAGVLALRLRRLRAAQIVLLGDGHQDLVAHAAGLERDYAALHAYVEDALGKLHERVATAEQRLDGAIAHRALVRYDAYGEMSGRQSTTLALLDARQSGVVLSSIHHRDSARLYAKQVRDGQAEIELSPEENEAVRAALDG